MNSTSITLSSYFALVHYYVTVYLLTSVFILGNLGNLSNIIIFSRKLLRSNVCSWYFIVFSIGNLISLYCGSFTRIIGVWSGFDLARISVCFCKFRIYFTLIGINLSRNFLALISIDRWIVTSRNVGIRRLSTPKIARSLIIISILFWTIFNIYALIGYQVDSNSTCYRSSEDLYVLIYTIFALFSIICPLLIMIIFSSLAILNVRKVIHRQTYPTIHTNLNLPPGRQYRRKDLALIQLSLVQVTVYIILNLLDMYNTIYGFTSIKTTKSKERETIDNFIGTIGIYLLYLYCAITFWLYIFASKTFRKEFILTYTQFLQRLYLFFHL